MLHPVGWPNHGPNVELYLAEEAVGLVKSLNWSLARGPNYETSVNDSDDERDLGESDSEDEDGDKRLKRKEEYIKENAHLLQDEDGWITFNKQDNVAQIKKEGITDGDYVYAPGLQGVYFKGGLILDFVDDVQDEEDEWKDINMRESVARSSLIRCRKTSSTTYFTKGKLNELGLFIKDDPSINVIYINSSLTPLQIKKLQKRWNDILLNREERLRQYYLKSAQKENYYSPTESDTSTAMSDYYGVHPETGNRKVRIIDRFGMILQIFAARALSPIAQIQIELAWLKYARTMLMRGNTPTFGQVRNMFGGNLMRQEMVEMGIKNERGQGTKGSIGGQGETQLQVEQFNLKVREAKLGAQLKEHLAKQNHHNMKR